MAFDEYAGAMFSPEWKTSERKYGVIVDNDVKIRMRDGVMLSCDVFRPDGGGKYPAIIGFHCYVESAQVGPIKATAFSSAQWRSPGQERTNASLESGEPTFFARRGYVHVVCNARGTGKSEGTWGNMTGPTEIQDLYEVIEWAAAQPWCDGNVAMFGVSYFAVVQFLVAALNPPHLKCLFAPWGLTDWYRDMAYRGGIFAYRFPVGWSATSLVYGDVRPELESKRHLGEDGFKDAVARMLEDEDIKAVPELVAALKNPEVGTNAFIVDFVINPLMNKYWAERSPATVYNDIKIPAYLGACWANYGLHLPGAFRSWENLDVPKKMIIGPPVYLDRPLYQLQHEAVRWFDYWMKGIDTGIMEEPPVRLFIMGTGEWKEATNWPVPGTKFTPFYLHENGLLSEREHWSYEGSSSYEDSPWMRGALNFMTPPMVEDTEVAGPLSLKLYAATTDKEVFWIVSVLEIDAEGKERLLTKGWLRGSHREIDAEQSKPWLPVHPHTSSEPLNPGKIYDFDIAIAPTGNLFKAGSRLCLRISSVDDEPTNALELICSGSLRRTSPSRITVFHNSDYPSYLLLPITKGNILGTYMSGGKLPPAAR